ncbi:succinate dehydrogenase, hydrophobic membrane anchor protein [Fangia hongkongensis]|uniref:succinate dehydrogenase, hydrophobic membrane anchor protein n=1 Tax=Fangia hongkongensis TaxID=270495 RepID=UPI00036100C5|nr:succinate dehydrogenase, hydrophobic membrane anchor protein [Fangia hongkongensis]MBK2125813.1 succinate dehydrogenase, hydrophobic membrane anchor protein [Fangia hongkongensis]
MGNVTACSRSGLKDWFIQRVSAIIILLYAIFAIVLVLCFSDGGSYQSWVSVFENTWVKIFTILAFLSLIFHAWIGMWTIFTDYVKCSCLRGLLQVLAVVGYFACFIWLICVLF